MRLDPGLQLDQCNSNAQARGSREATMYYLIVFLWAIACLACWALRRLQRKTLTISCIAVPLGGLAISLLLMALDIRVTAYILLAITTYLFIILISAVLTQRTHPST